MSGIRQWLEELGLGQYAETFEHGEIDIDLVRDLGDEALEKLGVSVMGHRVKMLRAIAALHARDGESVHATDFGEETARAKKTPALEAERRQRNLAASIHFRSPNCGPKICTPIGKRSSVNATGATVDGR
jgi:hypothetical protein